MRSLEEKREWAQQWREAHRAIQRARCKASREKRLEYYRAKAREYYHAHKDPVRKRHFWKKFAVSRRAFVDWVKSSPCMDCGGLFPPECMDFDHRNPSTKTMNPSALAGLARLQEEMTKCDLVCSNCHRIRTKRGRRVVQ